MHLLLDTLHMFNAMFLPSLSNGPDLVGEHFSMISEDGDDKLDGLHCNLELFIEGHGNDAVLKKVFNHYSLGVEGYLLCLMPVFISKIKLSQILLFFSHPKY